MDAVPLAPQFPVLLRARSRIVLVVASVLASCASARTVPQPPSDDRFAHVFELLGQVPLYLEFPGRPDILVSCERNRDEGCLRVYRDVRAAVAVIFRDGRGAALERTLATIAHACAIVQQRPVCRGGAVALYFFRSDAEDRKIVRELEGADKQVLEGVFDKDALSEWASYRPAPARWHPLVARAALTDEERREVTRALAGPLLPPYRMRDGTMWKYPMVHMVDPQYIEARRESAERLP